MTQFEFLKFLRDELKCLPTVLNKEGKFEEPSNSILKNWIQQKVVLVNGTNLELNQELPEVLEQFILFPKARKTRRIFEDFHINNTRSPRHWDLVNDAREHQKKLVFEIAENLWK